MASKRRTTLTSIDAVGAAIGRLALLVIVIAGCRRAGQTPNASYASLDDVAGGDLPSSAAPMALPPIELAPFTPGSPVSAPQGDPIRVGIASLEVGNARVRTQHTVARYDEIHLVDGKQKLRREITQKVFRIREEVEAMEHGRVTTVRALVLEGREVVTVDGAKEPTTILHGEYIVDVGRGQKPGRIAAQHATGRPLANRERDELGDLYAIDAGDEPALVKVLTGHPLRLGESVALTDAEREIIAGHATSGPISLTLVELVGDAAVYQIDASSISDAGATKSVRTTRERHTVRISTGQLIGAVFDTMQTEKGRDISGELQSRTVVKFKPATSSGGSEISE